MKSARETPRARHGQPRPWRPEGPLLSAPAPAPPSARVTRRVHLSWRGTAGSSPSWRRARSRVRRRSCSRHRSRTSCWRRCTLSQGRGGASGTGWRTLCAPPRPEMGAGGDAGGEGQGGRLHLFMVRSKSGPASICAMYAIASSTSRSSSVPSPAHSESGEQALLSSPRAPPRVGDRRAPTRAAPSTPRSSVQLNSMQYRLELIEQGGRRASWSPTRRIISLGTG